MTTLYLDRSGLELRADGGAIAIYRDGERLRSVPGALIERVVLQGDISVSTGLIGRLAEAGTGLLVLSKRHSRRVACLLGRPHADARRRLGQYRAWHDPGFRAAWGARLIARKIRNQRRVLLDALAGRPDLRSNLIEGARALDGAIEALRAPMPLAALQGTEGAAAAAYFRAYAPLFPPALGFTHRRRRPPPDPVNACLSLGYTLLHFEAVRAVHAAGLDPLIGFLHEPAYGRESLACDLIEPLRPRLDSWVWAQVRDRALRAEHFDTDKGGCLLGKAGRAVFYGAYEEASGPWRRWLRRLSQRLARQLEQGAPPIMLAEEALDAEDALP